MNKRHLLGNLLAPLLVLAVAGVGGFFFVQQMSRTPDDPGPFVPSDAPRHDVRINQPDGPPRVATGQFDPQGRAITVSCASCHDTREPNFQTRSAEELTEFHQDLVYTHGQTLQAHAGGLSCVTCHHPEDYNALRLADGSKLPFQQVMNLCAQCHGTQHRDFLAGVHGGMTGHWDLTRGERQRNNCIDCHDPHAPAYPELDPVFPPRDRFLSPSESGAHHE